MLWEIREFWKWRTRNQLWNKPGSKWGKSIRSYTTTNKRQQMHCTSVKSGRKADCMSSLRVSLLRDTLPANSFWAKGERFLSCGLSEFPNMFRLFSKISGKFPGCSEEFRSFTMRLGSTEEEQFSRLFPSKSVNLGLKHDLQGLFRSQIKPSLHFSVVNGSFKAY